MVTAGVVVTLELADENECCNKSVETVDKNDLQNELREPLEENR